MKNTTITQKNGITTVTLYRTEIIKADDQKIELNCGKYVTATTARRMNHFSEALELGFLVFRRKSKMWASHKGQEFEFDKNNPLTITR